jgi:hypothetical protein
LESIKTNYTTLRTNNTIIILSETVYKFHNYLKKVVVDKLGIKQIDSNLPNISYGIVMVAPMVL